MAKPSLHKKNKDAAATVVVETITPAEVGPMPDAPPPVASESTSLVAHISLPAVLDGEAVQVVQTSQGGVYVTFATARSANWTQHAQQVPGLQESDALLIRPDAPPVKLAPFKVHLMTAQQYWADLGSDGSVDGVTFSQPTGKTVKTECIDALLLVHHDGVLIPARCSFRRAQCQAGQVLASTLAQAATADWAKHSKAHEQSLVAPKPFLRFFGLIMTGRRAARSGNKYNVATATVHPAGPVEWNVVGAAFKDAAWKDAFDSALDSYLRRLDELKSHAE